MSAPNCIRGCRQPDADGGRPRPTPATDGQLCARCADQLWTMLGNVCEDYLELSVEIPETGPSERTATGAPGASPALVRLDVAAMLDPRTNLDPDDRAGLLYPPAVLASWARNLTEHIDRKLDVYGMAYAVEILREHWHALVSAPFLADFYDEMRTVTRALNSAHNRDRATYLGPCISTWLPAEPAWVTDWHGSAEDPSEIKGPLDHCEIKGPLDYCLAPVYRAASGLIHCRTCGRDYGPRDVIALSLAATPDTIEATP